MRLLKLKIKNIASLKGEHLISFKDIEEQSPLFAITGETGSGKSSLLNCISLALYGDLFKSNVGQLDVVTLGEKEGQIELIFQVKGKTYLAYWRARVRKQNGEPYATPPSPQRELYELEGEEFDSPKTITEARAEEILNLDFKQFCKCVVLNQGEFARFLTSTFSERKEILEKLGPGELLENLSTELFREINALKSDNSEIENKLSEQNLDNTDITTLNAEKEKLQKESGLFDGWLKHLETLESHFISLQHYHSKHREGALKGAKLKEELARGTSAYNQVLTQVQKLEAESLSAKKESQEKLPRLHELLKVEEGLKAREKQKKELDTQLIKLQHEGQELEKKSQDTKEQMEVWAKKEQEFSFLHPLDKLLEHKNLFAPLLDLENQAQLLRQDQQTRQSRLQEVELEGKEKAQEHKLLQEKLTSYPTNLKERRQELENKKKALQEEWAKKERAQLQVQALEERAQLLTQEQKGHQERLTELQSQLQKIRTELAPIETTLKLQTLLSAVEVCLTHPSVTDECPVCQRGLEPQKWDELKQSMQKTDIANLKMKEAELTRLSTKNEAEIVQLMERLHSLEKDIELKKKELETQRITATLQLPELASVDAELEAFSKSLWEMEKLQQDELKFKSELTKAREAYAQLKSELAQKEKLLQESNNKLSELWAPLKAFVIDLASLKEDSRRLPAYLEHQGLGEKLKQQMTHLNETKSRLHHDVAALEKSTAQINSKISEERILLEAELKGQNASAIIGELNQRAHETAERLNLKERELKKEAEALKLVQGQIYTLDEQLKDYDMQFTKELHLIREISLVPLPPLSEELKTFIESLQKLALELSSMPELFIPLREFLSQEKELCKEKCSELKMNLARVLERISNWEKRQDRIALLELKRKELMSELSRKTRLYEVLGKDELRNFVLSLVEESLIIQTNEELQKLCQGRYEIVHQQGRAKLPEFYIMDKFREGELRKVTTLSGGETFMVSLAMALGLAEMTRGKAEIDSLFIDEGFGTLDEESLEDVVDMLKQIQTRGLMVGVISHIKALTHAMPVNLVVSKRADGTSKVSLLFN